MELNKFIKNVHKRKIYRDLPDIYKTDKFLRLYLKMYEYIESIPKNEIVSSMILNRNDYIGVLFTYIQHFLEAKDFNNWRYRIYELVCHKFGSTETQKYKLLYGSNWSIYLDNTLKSRESTSMKHFGVKHHWQSQEIKEQIKTKNIELYGVAYPGLQLESNRQKSVEKSRSPEAKMKRQATNLRNFGVTCNLQSDEVRNKMKERYGIKGPLGNIDVINKRISTLMSTKGIINVSQDPVVKQKIIESKLKKYGNIYGSFESSTHSRIADEFCMRLYDRLNDVNCIFYEKDKREYSIDNKYYDFCIPDLKIIIEFDGLYFHGLKEGQKYVFEKRVEDVWKEDRDKQRLAEDMGFRVIRVREDEYERDKDGCIEKVLDIIGSIFSLGE